jgi:tetratricopeptide (TPR) repeat protein
LPPEAAKGEVVEEEEVYVNPMLADARQAFEKGELSSALADVDRFLGQNPRSPEGVELKRTILYQQGKVMLEQKKYAESYAALNQLAKLSPNYQDSSALLSRARSVLVQQHYNQGIRLYREEKLEPAIAEWRTVLEYDPNHEAAKKNIEQAERLLKGLQERQQKK